MPNKKTQVYDYHTEKQLRYSIKPYEGIDAIVVLGGEKKTLAVSKNGHLLDSEHIYDKSLQIFEGPRSKLALKLYKKLSKSRKSPIYNIFTGRCSGLRTTPVDDSETEAIQMGLYFLAHGVDINTVVLADDGYDTIDRIFEVEPLLKGHDVKSFALVTGEFKMPRALYTAKRMLGDKYKIVGLAAAEEPGSLLVETAVRATQFIDFNIIAPLQLKHPLEPGNMEQWKDYMDRMHPFHGNNADNPKKILFSLYGWRAQKMKRDKSAPSNYQLE